VKSGPEAVNQESSRNHSFIRRSEPVINPVPFINTKKSIQVF